MTLYAARPDMEKLFAEDLKRYDTAAKETGNTPQDTEPIALLTAKYEAPLSLERAAAEAGVQPQEFANRMKASPALSAALSVLNTENGLVKRDAWEDAFVVVSSELKLGAYVGIKVVVSKEGDGQFTSISEAVRGSRPGTQLFVRPGVYTESILLDKPIHLVGDGDPKTLVIQAPPGKSAVVSTGKGVVVSGFTLRGSQGGNSAVIEIPSGDAMIENCDIGGTADSGVWMHEKGSSATIRKCHVHDCSNYGVQGENCEVIISDCDFDGVINAAIILNTAIGTVRSCREHNCAVGLMVDLRSRCEANDCDFTSNRIGGVVIHNDAHCAIRKSHVNDNSMSGFDITTGGICTIEACEILRNGHSGITIHTNAECIVRSSQIHDSHDCGVNVWEAGKVTIEGCQIHGNANYGIQLQSRSTGAVRTSDLTNNHRGGYQFSQDCKLGSAASKF